MFVIRLPNGNLRVPQSAIHDGRIIGDAYVDAAFGSGAVDPPQVAFAGLVNAIRLDLLIYRGSDQRQVHKRLREICQSNAITEAVHHAATSSAAAG